MGSAGHSGCVTRRGVRRDSAQWAGLISTRERVFYGRCPGEEPQVGLAEKCLSNLEEEGVGQFRAGLLGAGAESPRRFCGPMFSHVDDLAGTKMPGFDPGHGFTHRRFGNSDTERSPLQQFAQVEEHSHISRRVLGGPPVLLLQHLFALIVAVVEERLIGRLRRPETRKELA